MIYHCRGSTLNSMTCTGTFCLTLVVFNISCTKGKGIVEFARMFPNASNSSCIVGRRTQVPDFGPNCTSTTRDLPTDCQDVFTDVSTTDGVYTIKPVGWSGTPFEVYCNMSPGGGWTVLQRRVNGSVDFYRNWTSFKEGFGIPGHELWLGNDKFYYLTNQRKYRLRIDLVNRKGDNLFLSYDFFRVSDEHGNYELHLGNYSGNADCDFMDEHRNHPFSTFDNDHDDCPFHCHGRTPNCAVRYHGAWWYNRCYSVNLNGNYNRVGDTGVSAYCWDTGTFVQGGFQYTEMKIRPILET